MRTKEESKEIKIAFFKALGDRMEGHRNALGKKTDWLAYKTGLKHLYFRVETDLMYTRLCIDLQIPEEDIRLLVFEQFEEMKKLFHGYSKTEYLWEAQFIHPLTKQNISRIYIELAPLSIYRTEDQSKIIDILEAQMLAFDQFWCEMKEVIINLVK